MLQFLKIMLEGKTAKMDERGASAVEYGLLVAGIAALVVLAVFTLGGTVDSAFDSTNTAITNNGGTGGTTTT